MKTSTQLIKNTFSKQLATLATLTLIFGLTGTHAAFAQTPTMPKGIAASAAIATTTAVTATAQNPANAQKPDELIKFIVNDVFNTIRNDKISSTDIKKLAAVVDKKIIPYADLTATTRSVVGPAWNKATPEQRKQITQEFKLLLIETYAGALTKVGQQEVKFKPLRSLPTDTKVIVRTEVIDNGEAKAIDYRLYKVGNQWKVYDLNILGMGLIATFTPDFAAQINKSGIDGLIAFLKNKTKN